MNFRYQIQEIVKRDMPGWSLDEEQEVESWHEDGIGEERLTGLFLVTNGVEKRSIWIFNGQYTGLSAI